MDLQKCELFDLAKQIHVPVLLIVGSEDETPPITQQKFYDKLPTNHKEIHIIEGSEHTFTKPEHLKEVKTIMRNWIKRL